MNREHRVQKYLFLLTICILTIGLLLTGCGGGAVVTEEEEVMVQEEGEEEVISGTSAVEEIPSEAIVGENVVNKALLIEGKVTLSSGEPAYKIGMLIKDAQGQLVGSTYTDREGKYRFYENIYYEEATYYIYHLFEGQDGIATYGYIPDAEVVIRWGQTTTVPVIRVPLDETPHQPTLTTSIDITAEIDSRLVPSIQGMVLFTDNTVGHDVGVILRQEIDNYKILAQIQTDARGYYAFYEVPAGVYWVNTISSNYYVSNVPDAVVIVSSGNTSTVEDLSEYKDIYILSINGVTPSYPRTAVDGGSVKFTWNAVENATYYNVEIWSTYTEEYPSNRDYDYTERTSDNSFTWSIDSSSLPYSEFRIDVRACSIENVLIASNYELFTVNRN